MNSKLPSIFLGALAIALVSSVISVATGGTGGMAATVAGCLLPILGAMFAVYHYTGRNELTVGAGGGAGIGALTGLLAGILGLALGFLLGKLGLVPDMFSPEGLEQIMDAQRDQMMERGMSDEEITAATEMSSNFMWVGLLVAPVFGAIIGAVGGAIGGAIFKKGPAHDEV